MKYIVRYTGVFDRSYEIEADSLEEAEEKASNYEVGEMIEDEEEIGDYSVNELNKLSVQKHGNQAKIFSQSTHTGDTIL